MKKRKDSDHDLLTHCSACGKTLGKNGVHLVSREERRTIFHVSCAGCMVSALVILSGGPKGVITAGMLTDLSKEEVREKIGGKAIDADEIIEVYQMMNGKEESLKG